MPKLQAFWGGTTGAKHLYGFISERFDSHPVSTAGKKSDLRPALKPPSGLTIITLFPRVKPLIFVEIPEERWTLGKRRSMV
jgi:hypothetical protein